MAEEQTLNVIANPHAPDVFADAAASFSLIGGVIRMTLTAVRPLEVPGSSAHVVIGQLAMPLEGAQALSVGLYDFLKAQGAAPSGETVQ
jgi:hypothetical protein